MDDLIVCLYCIEPLCGRMCTTRCMMWRTVSRVLILPRCGHSCGSAFPPTYLPTCFIYIAICLNYNLVTKHMLPSASNFYGTLWWILISSRLETSPIFHPFAMDERCCNCIGCRTIPLPEYVFRTNFYDVRFSDFMH